MSQQLVRPVIRTVMLLLMAGLSLRSPASHRCVPGYDVFGPYTIPLGGNVAERVDAMRSFIWTHWRNHRPGCATLTSTSPGGEFVTCTEVFIIEPDMHGRWNIDEEVRCGAGGRGRPKPTNETNTWDSVQRMARSGGGARPNEPLPESADVPANSYVLIFSDASGRRSPEF